MPVPRYIKILYVHNAHIIEIRIILSILVYLGNRDNKIIFLHIIYPF